MNTLKGELTSFETVGALKPFLSSSGPCISVYMPLSTASTAGLNPNAKQNELHWKECLRRLDDRVSLYGSEGRELLESLSELGGGGSGTGAPGQIRRRLSFA